MSVTEQQRRSPLLLLGAVALVGWALSIVAIIGRPDSSPRSQPSPIESQITYATTGPVRLSAVNGPIVLHRFSYESAGGLVTICWYDSDVEPTTPKQIALVSLYVDRVRVASTVKTALTGTGEDGQGDLVWRGPLAKGRHEIEVSVDNTDAGPWGIPYIDRGLQGVDELIIDRSGGRAT